ncbi:MAG: hypothetical protein RBT33_00810 [Candidatus Dojkabacteria bacterium]|jgi:hypothetical protein|nr:hypothetical protein [Candidatus Dojkabacteria bacterium]MDX9738893.1 hypothetical protein [Candidatus Dojkabacteria bacterium]
MKKTFMAVFILLMAVNAFALDLGKFSLSNTVRAFGSDDEKRPTRLEYTAKASVKDFPVWIQYTHRTDVGDDGQENTGYNQYTVGYDVIKSKVGTASIVVQEQNYTDNKDTVRRAGIELKF